MRSFFARDRVGNRSVLTDAQTGPDRRFVGIDQCRIAKNIVPVRDRVGIGKQYLEPDSERILASRDLGQVGIGK